MTKGRRRIRSAATRRRRWQALGAAAVLFAVALVPFLLDRSPTTAPLPPPPGGKEAAAAPGEAGAAWPDPKTSPEQARARRELLSTLRTPRQRYEFYTREAAYYRRISRYPKNNEPLKKGDNNPIRGDYHRLHREKASDEDERVVLVLDSPTSQVVAPQPMQVDMWMMVGGERVDATYQVVLAKGPPHPEPRQRVDVQDEGRDGDVAGDLVYRWFLAPATQEEVERATGIYNLYVSATTKKAPFRTVASTVAWQYSAPAGARLTGRYRDAIVEGNLRIESEVEVYEPGRYHLMLSLSAPGDEPIAWAQNDQVRTFAEPGTYWIPIDIYGLLIFERRLDGPYRVDTIVLRNVSIIPPRTAGLMTDVYETAPYSWRQFTDQPFNDPVDLRKAEFLEREAAAAAAQLDGSDLSPPGDRAGEGGGGPPGPPL